MSKKWFFQYDPSKTPMENAMRRIKFSYVMAFISASATLIIGCLPLFGVTMVEKGIGGTELIAIAVFIFILAILIMKIKSRVASVILLGIFLVDLAFMCIQAPALFVQSLLKRIIFGVAYYQGVEGTIAYHKLKKQDKLNSQEEPKGNVAINPK